MSTQIHMSLDFKKTINRHLFLLGIIGLDLLDDSITTRSNFMRKHGRFIFFNIVYVILNILVIIFIATGVRTGASFLSIANAIPCVLMFTQEISSLQIIFFRRHRIREVFKEIDEIWPTDKQNCEKAKTMKDALRRLKIYDNSYFGVTVVTTVAALLLPIFLTIFSMVMGPEPAYYFPIDIFQPYKITSFVRFLSYYFYVALATCSIHICVRYSAIFLLAALTCDISMLLSILQIDLENVVQYNKDEGKTINVEETDEKLNALKEIVKTHQKLLRIAKNLNDIFDVIILIPCGISAQLCFFLFMVVINLPKGFFSFMVLRNVFFSIYVVLELFNLIWPGQLLFDTSSGVADAAYLCLWYERNTTFKKIILNIIRRSQRPAYLSAMGFSYMTFALLSKILSTSWSYLSLLVQMCQDNEFV